MSGTQLLARVRQFFPTARRGLLIPWGERSTPAPFLEAAALGQLEFYLNRPAWSPDEQFHRVITGSLEEWWRAQGRRSELVTVIGDDPSARVHEIRDVLARNNVPFGFYASDSPGLSTALLEREAFGGQAGTSSRIRNYLGFPDGVSGGELAQRAYEQAWVFGTHLVYGNAATSLAKDQDLLVVGLEDGSQARARAVVIATGVSYRRLGIPELEALAGAGVFYGAGTIEAQAVAGNRPLWWAAATQPGRPRCICRNTHSRSRSSSGRSPWRRACPTT